MALPPLGSKPPRKQIQGGFASACFYSGAVVPSLVSAPNAVAVGADVMLASGPGRLDTILVHYHTAQSGYILPVVFYDAVAPVSGGPFASSGHRVLAITPAFVNQVSGAISPAGAGNTPVSLLEAGVPYIVSIPFQSGLCFNSRSGQPGFSAAWTQEPGGVQ